MLSTFRESTRTAQNNGDRIGYVHVDSGREANEGLRVGLRIRRIPRSRRLNTLFSHADWRRLRGRLVRVESPPLPTVLGS